MDLWKVKAVPHKVALARSRSDHKITSPMIQSCYPPMELGSVTRIILWRPKFQDNKIVRLQPAVYSFKECFSSAGIIFYLTIWTAKGKK